MPAMRLADCQRAVRRQPDYDEPEACQGLNRPGERDEDNYRGDEQNKERRRRGIARRPESIRLGLPSAEHEEARGRER